MGYREVRIDRDRHVDGYGLLRAGETYSLDEETAAMLSGGAERPSDARTRTATLEARVQAPETQTEEGAPETTAERTGKAGGKWTLKTPPAEYLERYPDGPNAGLARALTGE